MEDLLQLVVYLALGAVYLWGQIRKNKRKRENTQSPPPEVSGETRGATPFQDFMRQMEVAMREGVEEPLAHVEKPLSAPDTMKPKPIPVSTIPPARVEAFHDLGSFQNEKDFGGAKRTPHQEHGFGMSSPFSEERFEKLGRGLDITEHAPGHLDAGPHSLRPQPVKRLSRAGAWRERLKNPKEAQDALVLSEIFGGPWKARRPHKR